MERLSQLMGKTPDRRSHYLKIVDSTLASSSEEQAMILPDKKPGICLKCHGAGYLRVDVPFGHSQFGKPVECECKKAEKKERERRHLEEISQIQMLERFANADFNSFDVTRPGVKEAYRAAMRFASRPRGWLVLSGSCGCGKTHLAVSVAKERLSDGEGVLLQTVPDFLDYLRSAFNPKAEEAYNDLFARLRETEVLLLDDLGAESDTAWAREKLFQLLNHRYNSMLPTMITLNHVNVLEPRIASRLNDKGLVTHIAMTEAMDYRPLAQLAVDEL